MMVVVQENIDLTVRHAKRRQDFTVHGHAIRVLSVSCNAEKDSFFLYSGNRSFLQTHGTFKLRLGLDSAR